jgi:hypothetical protein
MVYSSLFLLTIVRGRVCGLVIGRQRLVPHPVRVDPQGRHPGRVELVHATRALGPADDQAAVLKDAQVLGDRRTGNRQLPGQLADRARVPGQQLEDRAPGEAAQQAQAVFVSPRERLVG